MLRASPDTGRQQPDGGNFLIELAEGKHDKEVAYVQKLLRVLGTIWPPARLVSRAIAIFMVINKLTSPWGGVTLDGRGGMVPKSNSRVHPIDGRFIKWTNAGWVYDDFIGGKVQEKLAPPGAR